MQEGRQQKERRPRLRPRPKTALAVSSASPAIKYPDASPTHHRMASWRRIDKPQLASVSKLSHQCWATGNHCCEQPLCKAKCKRVAGGTGLSLSFNTSNQRLQPSETNVVKAPCVPWTAIKTARRRVARKAPAALQVVAQRVACSGAGDLEGACLLPELAGLLPQSTHAGHQQIVALPTFMVARGNHDALPFAKIHCPSAQSFHLEPEAKTTSGSVGM